MPMEDTLQAIARLSSLRDETAAVRYQRASFSNLFWRNPDRWNESCGKQASEIERIASVGFHPGSAHEFDEKGVGDRDGADERRELVMQIPGIGRCFQNHCIGRMKVSRRPLLALIK